LFVPMMICCAGCSESGDASCSDDDGSGEKIAGGGGGCGVDGDDGCDDNSASGGGDDCGGDGCGDDGVLYTVDQIRIALLTLDV